jgi:hypothetical protein
LRSNFSRFGQMLATLLIAPHDAASETTRSRRR